jgi:C1A family cysteine protease
MNKICGYLIILFLVYLFLGRFVFPWLFPVSWRPRHRGGKFKQAVTLPTRAPAPGPNLPSSFDWRSKLSFDVPSQGACGACFAFAPVIALQKRFELAGRPAPALSAQHILDCEQYCSDASNIESCDEGCAGGLLDHSWQFLQEHGVPAASVVPYRGYTQQCQVLPPNTPVFKAAEIQIAFKYRLIKSEIASHGPVTAGMDAYSCFANFRGNGVYERQQGSASIGAHAVVLIGWTSDGWIGMNVWGKSWGNNGFFTIKYKECNIENGVVTGTPL